MRSRLLAWTATVVLVSLGGTGTAMANDVVPGQVVGQTAAGQQTADADASSTQVQPTNQNVSVRVLSPGDSGAVTQSNETAAAAAVANAAAAQQAAAQSAPSGGTQAVGQAAQSSQSADAGAESTQVAPTNRNVSVRVLSEGDDGDVEQANTSSAKSAAINANDTAQAAEQAGGGASGGTQAVGQKADSEQDADADASSVQDHPSNVNASVRVLSEGDDGDVEQANTSSAKSAAINANETAQAAEQAQDQAAESDEERGQGQAPESDEERGEREAPESDEERGQGQAPESDEDNGAGRAPDTARNERKPGADDETAGTRPEPESAPGSRHESPREPPSREVAGRPDRGGTDQDNASKAGAIAANGNETRQGASEAQRTPTRGGLGIQAIGQKSVNDQDADASATSRQRDARNVNAPVRVLSSGDHGDVDQENGSSAGALALNRNATAQLASQVIAGGDDGLTIQALGQAASNSQDADAQATSEQHSPSNVNAPVAIGDGTGTCRVEPEEKGDDDGDSERPACRPGGDLGHATDGAGAEGGESSVEQTNNAAPTTAAGLNASGTGQLAQQE